jgi:predicted butyrate kinase (DUF1464 family)
LPPCNQSLPKKPFNDGFVDSSRRDTTKAWDEQGNTCNDKEVESDNVASEPDLVVEMIPLTTCVPYTVGWVVNGDSGAGIC